MSCDQILIYEAHDDMDFENFTAVASQTLGNLTFAMPQIGGGATSETHILANELGIGDKGAAERSRTRPRTLSESVWLPHHRFGTRSCE